MRIDLNCESCGGNRFSFPEQADDWELVACEDCAALLGTIGSLKLRLERAVMDKGEQT
jgi:hypothetical protein